MNFVNISPSRLGRIVRCPGSVTLCEKFPVLLEQEQEEARRGTLAHWLAVEYHNGSNINQWLGQSPINDQVVDREMINHVDHYVNNIITESGEFEFHLQIFDGEFKGFEGTADFLRYDSKLRRLTIKDLKYGFLKIAAYRNWQLLGYSFIWSKMYPSTPIEEIQLEIFQPRGTGKDGGHKIWKLTYQEAIDHYFHKIEQALRDCQFENATTRAGDHCHYCSAMLQCDTNLQTCLRIVNLGAVQHGQEPTNQQLSDQLKLFKFAKSMLDKRLKIVETVTFHRLQSGQQIPGYTLEYSSGHRKWNIAPEYAQVLGIPLKPSEIMSPAQAEKHGFHVDLVKKYTQKTKRIKLVEFNINRVEELLKDGN